MGSCSGATTADARACQDPNPSGGFLVLPARQVRQHGAEGPCWHLFSLVPVAGLHHRSVVVRFPQCGSFETQGALSDLAGPHFLCGKSERLGAKMLLWSNDKTCLCVPRSNSPSVWTRRVSRHGGRRQFGTQGLNDTSAAKTVTLTNKNSTAITLFGETVTGTNASAFAISATTCSTSLAAQSWPGASWTHRPGGPATRCWASASARSIQRPTKIGSNN